MRGDPLLAAALLPSAPLYSLVHDSVLAVASAVGSLHMGSSGLRFLTELCCDHLLPVSVVIAYCLHAW
jgi:hypothetical protein